MHFPSLGSLKPFPSSRLVRPSSTGESPVDSSTSQEKVLRNTTPSKKKRSTKGKGWHALLPANNQDYEFLRTDSKYLLRLTQQSDWKNIEKCCSMLSRIFRGSKDKHIDPELIITARNQLSTKDSWGNTPLHMVCYHRPPTSIVRTLLKVTSHAIKQGGGDPASSALLQSSLQLHTQVNDGGATPLLICCRSGASLSVMELLLDPPTRTLHKAGSTAYQMDHHGNSPFSGLLNRYQMVQKIPYFQPIYQALDTVTVEDTLPLEVAPAAIADDETFDCDHEVGDAHQEQKDTVVEEHGNMAPQLADKFHHHRQVQELLLGHVGGFGCGQEHDHDTQQLLPFQLFWKSIERLLQASSNEHRRELSDILPNMPINTNFSLCPAALVADVLPPNLTDLILRLYYDGDRDSCDKQNLSILPHDADLILHLVICKPQDITVSHPESIANRSYFLQRILALNPSIATSCLPSDGRRSMLHQAIAAGLTWHVADIHRHDRTSFVAGPIPQLLERSPDALRERDEKTGLYPFQLAAVVESPLAEEEAASKEHTSHGMVFQLDTIFNLLRHSPELIES